MPYNGDTDLKVLIDGKEVVGLGSFHKTLPHNEYGEVEKKEFDKLVDATHGTADFTNVTEGPFFNPPAKRTAPLTNPRAGLAQDRLVPNPSSYEMPPAPKVQSDTTAAEMTELYWMALLRDVPFDEFDASAEVGDAATEINKYFGLSTKNSDDSNFLQTGIDVPGSRQDGGRHAITPQNLFRLGLPGEDIGPLVSQFFLRPVSFGTQTIDQRQLPYRKGVNYLTRFSEWHNAQDSGNGEDGRFYNNGNEARGSYYERPARYISTMRDMARFVHKDALHQAYFNAALLMLSGGAKWTLGNPYRKDDNQPVGPLSGREAGFGTLGGPHILALVSEVATRALKAVWHEKWQVHLRLRPEAYGGLVHVQNIGVDGKTRAYGLRPWVAETEAAKRIKALNGQPETLLLPMAFTSGSPLHPAYGAGHATVAGACVTVLKAFFRTFDDDGGSGAPVPLVTKNEGKDGGLMERPNPYDSPVPFQTYVSGVDAKGRGRMTPMPSEDLDELTLEGELNKLAMNVAMGRSMGGVHWRTDNTRSLMLGEAMAARILFDITEDVAEDVSFRFRTFSRKANGYPKIVVIDKTGIKVDGINVDVKPNFL